MKTSLFDENELEGSGALKGDTGSESIFQINEKYAKKYEAVKRAAELRALEEKYAQRYKQYLQEGDEVVNGGSSDAASRHEDSDSSEDESDVVEDEQGATWLAQTVDKTLLNVIKQVRNKSENVYDGKRQFYEKEKLTEQAEAWRQARASSHEEGLFLAQYHNQLVKDKFYEKAEEGSIVSEVLPYEKEQEKLKAEMRAAFHHEADPVDAETEDFFKISKKTDTEKAGEEKELEAIAAELITNDDDAFLMDYLLKKAWLPRKKKAKLSESVEPERDEPDDDLLMDEPLAVLEEAEEFEQTMNMRYEALEQKSQTFSKSDITLNAPQLVGHARDLPGVRREDTTRKDKRMARKEKQRLERLREEEELKRLKNLKKLARVEKMAQICQVAGTNCIDVPGLADSESEEFDPVKFDQKMNALFNDTYYQQEESDPKLLKSWMAEETAELDEEAVQHLQQKHVDIQGEKQLDRKSAVLAPHEALSFEDRIRGVGGTRFRYQRVLPSTFGLPLDDIVVAPEKSLNSLVSLKKLAPYKTQEEQEADSLRYGKKKNIRKFYHHVEKVEKKMKQEDGSK